MVGGLVVVGGEVVPLVGGGHGDVTRPLSEPDEPVSRHHCSSGPGGFTGSALSDRYRLNGAGDGNPSGRAEGPCSHRIRHAAGSEVVFVQPILHRVEPFDPLAWAVGLVLRADDERLTTQRTDSLLAGCQGAADLVHRWRCARLVALTPEVTESRVVG